MSIKLPRINTKPPLKQKENLSQANIEANPTIQLKNRAFTELEKNLFDKLDHYQVEDGNDDDDNQKIQLSHKKNSVSNMQLSNTIKKINKGLNNSFTTDQELLNDPIINQNDKNNKKNILKKSNKAKFRSDKKEKGKSMMNYDFASKDITLKHNHTTTMVNGIDSKSLLNKGTQNNGISSYNDVNKNKNNDQTEKGNDDGKTFLTSLMQQPQQNEKEDLINPNKKKMNETDEQELKERDDYYLNIRQDDDEDDAQQKLIIQEINKQLEEFESDQVTELKSMITKTKKNMSTMINDISNISNMLSEINQNTKSIGYKIKGLEDFEQQYNQIFHEKDKFNQSK